MEAMRALKRRLSVVYRQMINDATAVVTGSGGHQGTSTNSSVTSSHPHNGASEKSFPEPVGNKLKAPPKPAAWRRGEPDQDAGERVSAGSGGGEAGVDEDDVAVLVPALDVEYESVAAVQFRGDRLRG